MRNAGVTRAMKCTGRISAGRGPSGRDKPAVAGGNREGGSSRKGGREICVSVSTPETRTTDADADAKCAYIY